METNEFLYGFLTSCHGNRCPYRHTDHLGADEKLSWVDTCAAVYCSRLHVCVCVFISGWRIPLQTPFELSWSPWFTARDVTCTVSDL